MSAANIGILATVVGTLLAVITATVILVKYFTKLENKVDGIRGGVNQVIRQSNGMLGLFGTVIGLLSKRGVIEKEDIGSILKDFTVIGHITEIHPNPLTIAETNTLNGYIRRARQGGEFTRTEVEEYNALVRRLDEERPNDPNIWPLLALAALLLGLYFASRSRED